MEHAGGSHICIVCHHRQVLSVTSDISSEQEPTPLTCEGRAHSRVRSIILRVAFKLPLVIRVTCALACAFLAAVSTELPNEAAPICSNT